ncbi:hypothetical protein LTR95_010821 [Oleoguttula sp. CCFEE 5521]
MEFDQSYTGSADWSFPSPGATPTHASFDTVLQTPKTSGFPSHFQDAFSTPQMPSYGTPQQHHYPSRTAVHRPQSSSETLRNGYYAAVQAQTPAHLMQAVPLQNTPAVPAHAMSHAGVAHASLGQAMGPAIVDYTQMQTPPPTRGASARKAQANSIAFGTPSTIASRRFQTPQQQYNLQSGPQQQTSMAAPQHQTSMLDPMLHFSPSLQQYANMGPATAPVVNHSRNYWETQASPALAQPIMLDDPFGMNMQPPPIAWTPNPAMLPQQSNAQSVSFDTPAMDSFSVQQPHPRPMTAAPNMSTHAHYAPTFMPPMTSSVDPSLLYSSPMRPVVHPTSRTSRSRPTMEELDSRRKDSAASSAASFALSNDLAASRSESSLRRSNTTGAGRPTTSSSAAAAISSISRSNSIHQPPRTSSPLKRVGRTPLGSISESITRTRSQRASVVLTVDENGRARTQTLDVDSHSPTKAARQKYPGLFDDDSSDEESDASAEPPSRNASFSFARSTERRSKAAKLDPPIENLEGLTLPRSASSTSIRATPSRAAIVAAAQLKRHGSLRKPTPSRRAMTASASQTSLIDTCPMDFGDTSSIGEESTPSLSPEDFGVSRYPPAPPLFGSMDNLNYAVQSQVTAGAHDGRWRGSFDPQFSQRHAPVIRIRCPCGDSTQTSRPLVQCRSCTQWQHPDCVGVDLAVGQHLEYTCFLCTRPATNAVVGKSRR